VTIAPAIVTRLEAVSAVTNLVGDQIYQGTLPQDGAFPAVLVRRIGEVIQLHLRGSTSMFKERIQIDSYADSSEPIGDAQAIDSAVFGDGSGSSLVGFTGEIDAYHIYCVEPAGAREQYEGEELRQYRVMRDVFVTWAALPGSPS